MDSVKRFNDEGFPMNSENIIYCFVGVNKYHNSYKIMFKD